LGTFFEARISNLRHIQITQLCKLSVYVNACKRRLR